MFDYVLLYVACYKMLDAGTVEALRYIRSHVLCFFVFYLYDVSVKSHSA